jgi:hypothetical protein
MAAGRYDFAIEQGSTFSKLLCYQNPDGSPIDITGYVAELQAKKLGPTSLPLIDLSTGNGGIVIDGPNGTITLSMTDEAAALLDFIRTAYDLKLTPPGGKAFRLLKGSISLDREVTGA